MATLGERIRGARTRKQLSQKSLASAIGVKSGTVISNWESGYAEPSANMLVALADALNVGLDQLLDYYGGTGPIITSEDSQMIEKYHALDTDGRAVVDAVLNLEYERCARRPSVETDRPYRLLNVYGTAAAGPSGAWDLDGDPEQVQVVLDCDSERADYVVVVSGDSMLPDYHNGDLLLVQQTSAVEPGELAVFRYDGLGYFKQMGVDGRLLSLNPDYAPIAPEDGWVQCQGRVIGIAQKVDE